MPGTSRHHQRDGQDYDDYQKMGLIGAYRDLVGHVGPSMLRRS